MRNIIISTLFICCSFLTGLSAQMEVWPVQLTGSMLPPYSLDLKVYGEDRAGDLTFQAQLNDPEQQTLMVKPVLTIEQNGSVLYQTDLNYAGQPIMLSQFEPIALDGTALNSYLANIALTGVTPGSKGSIIIPEGFNQVCLQLYGVDRQVPVSNKFCLSGNFRLNQPPQLVLPAFNEKIKMPATQTMLFTWQPMHLGSGNNPGVVEYTFEIVELPMGVMNADDVFESALKVYTTTTTATSLIYSQAEPTLEADKYYAWRITAKSMMYPTSKLFQNDGRSEVSLFILYTGDEPADGTNPFDNPSPRGCSVYETNYGPVGKSDNTPSTLSANQKVKLGYFEMIISEANGSPEGYSGKGWVSFPMLRSVLEVSFDGLKVNKENRVYASDRIEAVLPAALQVSTSALRKENIDKTINATYLDALNTALSDAKKDVSQLPEGNISRNELPMKLSGSGTQEEIAVTGIFFTPTNAFLNLVSHAKGGSVYAATGIPATPYGMKSNAYLVPINVAGVGKSTTKLLPAIELGRIASKDSRMTCDCKGFVALDEKSSLSINPDIVHTVGSKNPIPLELSKPSKDYSNYLGSIRKIPAFEVPGLTGFQFSATSGSLDLSESQNNSSSVPKPYTNAGNPTWKGVIMNDVVSTIPARLNFLNKNENLVMDKGRIFIDDKEIAYGQFIKTDVLNFSKGKLGPWRYSIDSMMLTMTKLDVGNFQLTGKIKAPYFDDAFGYKAEVTQRGSQPITLNALIPPTSLDMSMWHGTFQAAKGSEVKAVLIDGGSERQFVPKCDFDGDMDIRFTNQAFKNAILNTNKGEAMDLAMKALGVDNFDFELKGLKLTDLTCDPYKEKKDRYGLKEVSKDNATLGIGKKSFSLKDITFIHTTDNNERLGLKMAIVNGTSKVEITVWAHEANGNLEFEGVELTTLDLNCNCTALSVIPTKAEWERILEEFYERRYGSPGQMLSYNGGVKSQPALINYDLVRNLTKIDIDKNAIAWFPTLDDKSALNIPFLNRDINIENRNGAYYGTYSDAAFASNNINWTDDLFAKVINAESGNLNLPILITPDMWSQFGFKGNYTLPDNFKLFVSEFKTNGADKLSAATIKVRLVGQLNVDGKIVYVDFGNLGDIAIGPEKVNFKDVYLHLLRDTKLNENITYQSTVNNGNANESIEEGSYVKLTCEEGVHKFNLQGSFQATANTIIANNPDKTQAVFAFHLNEDKINDNSALLAAFIAPLKRTQSFQSGSKEWEFSTTDDQHLLFSPGAQFEGYLDFNTTASVKKPEVLPTYINEFTELKLYNEGFTGLIFTEMAFKVPSLEMKRIDDKTKPEILQDTVFSSFYEIGTNSFFSKYIGNSIVSKQENARLGNWRYQLDSIYYNIEYNSLDEDKLFLNGKIRIPIFREAPEKDKEKWLEKYKDAWVGFNLNTEYNKNTGRIDIAGFADDISGSMFELKYIDGLGLMVNHESMIEVVYDNFQKRMIARGEFSGRSVYTIEKLDATIPLLRYEGLKINHDASGLCKSTGTDGIESVDFGTWDIGTVVDTLKDKLNKFGSANKLVGFDINIQKPTFQCTGQEWKFLIGLDVSFMRDENHLNDDQRKAHDLHHPEEAANRMKKEAEDALAPLDKEYKAAQEGIRKVAVEKKGYLKEKEDFQRQINELKNNGKISLSKQKEITELKTKMAATDKKIADVDTRYKSSLATVKEKYKPYKEQNTRVKAATNEAEAQTKIAISNKNKPKPATFNERVAEDKATIKSKTDEAIATKTGSFSASGSIEVTFDANGFKGVGLTCLQLGGEFGPVKFDGGINLFRDETTKETYDPNAVQSAWGNGFLGMINLRVLSYQFQTKFQTGVKFDIPKGKTSAEDYRYWFADLSLNASPGIPLGQTSFELTGVGGGFYYNMEQVPAVVTTFKTPPANNDNCKAPGLKAGVSLSGMTYRVQRGSFGGYLTAEVSHTARISLAATVKLEMSLLDGEFKFKKFGLGLDGYFFYEDYFKRKTESPGIVKGTIDINFENEIVVSGGVDFQFQKKAGPITINSPKGSADNKALWNSIRFYFSKYDQYVHAGSWGLPEKTAGGPMSKLNMLSAGFEFDSDLIGQAEVSAGLYAQFGTKTDGLPPLNYLLPNYDGRLKQLSNTSYGKANAIAGFKLDASLKGGVLNFKWNAAGTLAANLAILNSGKGVNCGGTTRAIGIAGGRYAQGYVFLDMMAKVYIDYWFDTWNILDAKVSTLCDFGFPNPSFLEGDFKVEYEIDPPWPVPDIKGSINLPISVGEKPCGTITPDPTIGIRAHREFIPENGATGIKSLSEITLGTNVFLQQEFPISKSNDRIVFLKCVLDKFELKEKISGQIVQVTAPLDLYGMEFYYRMKESLKPNTTYTINAVYKWLRVTKENDKLISEENKSEEKVTSEFTTGMPEDVITQDMIAAQYPGYRQRFWYKGYEKAKIVFKQDVSQEQFNKIFREDEWFMYFASIIEKKTDGSVVYHKTPVKNFPSKMIGWPTFATDRTLFLPGVDTMTFAKGSFCTMNIYRAENLMHDVEITDEVLKGCHPYKETQHQKLVYTTHFGISQYDNVVEKVQNVKVSAAVGTAGLVFSKRPLYMGKEQVQEIVDLDVSTRHEIPQNVYYGIMGTTEGIDSFDVNKLKGLVDMSLSQSPPYHGWTKKYLYGNYFVFCLNGFRTSPEMQAAGGKSKYVDSFMASIARSKKEGEYEVAKDNEYALFRPENSGNKYEITAEEITAGVLSSGNIKFQLSDGPVIYDGKTSSDWNPDFIIEDGVASTAVLQYLFTKITLINTWQKLGSDVTKMDFFTDGEGLNNSKYYGSNKYFLVNNPVTGDSEKFLLENYYSYPSTLLFQDGGIPAIIRLDPDKYLFKNIAQE